ncbi:hypothetical protein GY45DRAFT_1341620 [Cubamyces sp. BRFM 1775]|nr:hypothetical protein GY45DRAFT_1341620 [Cubamyces sp. BRFM 1775]
MARTTQIRRTNGEDQAPLPVDLEFPSRFFFKEREPVLAALLPWDEVDADTRDLPLPRLGEQLNDDDLPGELWRFRYHNGCNYDVRGVLQDREPRRGISINRYGRLCTRQDSEQDRLTGRVWHTVNETGSTGHVWCTVNRTGRPVTSGARWTSNGILGINMSGLRVTLYKELRYLAITYI